MKPTSLSATLDQLAVEAAWLRRLAASLVQDQAAAEDLVHDTMVVAAEQPPRDDRPLRPWLVRVLTNRVRMYGRGAARRSQREQAVAALAVEPATPDEIVDRVELQRMLAGFVLELARPLREVVLLRYFEGLSSGAIGTRLGIASSTVRWRLKQAIDELRSRLDQRSPNRAWVAPLAGFAGVPRAGAASSTALVAGSIAALLALVVVVVVLAWRALPEPEPIAVPARGGESMAAIVARSVEAAESPGATIAPGFSAVPIDPEQRRFTGRVVDRDGGPVDDAEIRIRCMYRDELQTGPQTTRSKPDGTFAFEVDRDCSPSVRAAKGDAISRRASTLPIRARELHKEPFVLELVPVPVALFKVLDAHTGAPLAGARLSTDVFRSISAVADASGVARIPVEDYLDLQKLSRRDPTLTSFRTISIDAPGYPSVREPLFDASARLPDDDPRTVRLVRGIPVSGRVVDRDGRGIAGAYVVIEDDADSEPRTTDASGAFEVAVPRPGRYRALVVPPGRSARRGVPAIDVEIGADGTDLELPLREPERLGELTGTVVDGHGNPVTGARVRTRGRPLQSELRPVVTDARGRFSFPIWLVAPSPDENGATTVFVVATHGSLASALTPVEIRDHAQNIELTLPIGPAGIAGVVVDLDGGPVPGADVWLNFCCGKYKLIEGTRVEADAQGRFAFDVPRGEFVLSVRRSRDDDFDDRDDRTVSGGSHDVRLVVP